MPSLLQEARAGACEVVANGVNFFWRKAHLQGEKPTMPALAHANGVGPKDYFLQDRGAWFLDDLKAAWLMFYSLGLAAALTLAPLAALPGTSGALWPQASLLRLPASVESLLEGGLRTLGWGFGSCADFGASSYPPKQHELPELSSF